MPVPPKMNFRRLMNWKYWPKNRHIYWDRWSKPKPNRTIKFIM